MPYKILLTLLMISCAQSQLYLKKSELTPFKKFSKQTKVQNISQAFTLVQINDRRNVANSLGVALTGGQFTETPVLLKDESLEGFLKNYFTLAFQERGFVVTEQSENKMFITINKLWVDELIEKFKGERARCHVDFTVNLTIGNGQQWQSQTWTKITSHGDMGDASDKIPQTLASCLNEAVEKVVKNKSFLRQLL